MPHNLYLHSSLVLSRKINTKSKQSVHEANIYNAIESAISLFISFLISFAVVGTFAFYHDTSTTPIDLNLRNADQALQQSFGSGARVIWGLGLLAAGQSSTMTGTYAGQFVMEGFLDIKLPVWKRVFFTRCIAVMPALVVAFIADYDEVDTYLNILQSIQLPFALIPLIKFTSSEQIMTPAFTNSRLTTVFASSMGVMLFLINFIGLFRNLLSVALTGIQIFALFSAVAAYLALIIIVIRVPVSDLKPAHPDDEEEEDIVDNARSSFVVIDQIKDVAIGKL